MNTADILESLETMSTQELEYLQRLLIIKYIPLAHEREYNELRGDNVVRGEAFRVDEQDPERDQ